MSDKYPGGLVTAAAPAGYSVAFDGTGDYLTVPSNVALTLGTGNFCLEFWAYPTSFSATRSWLSNRNGTETNRWGIDSNTSGQFYLYGNGGFVVTSTVQTVNQWVHVCVTRAGTGSNQTRIFINGALSAVGTSSTDFAADIVSIGASPTGSQAAIGNVSNARIIKGSIPAEYTTTSTTVGAQIFSPPTQLFPVTNTSLLACQSPTIIDNSSNNFAITVAGNAAVSTFTPFPSSYYFYNAPTDGNTRNMLPSNIAGFNPAYGAAAPGVWTLDQAQYFTANRLWPIYDPYFNLTTLMLSGNQPSGVTDTNNNVFKDSSTNNFSITRNGNTTQGTFSPFSQTGWSNFFDGTADYLTAAGANLALGTGDFTIEFWFYANAYSITTDSSTMFDSRSGGNTTGFQIGPVFNATDKLTVGQNTSPIITASTTYPLNTWVHCAVVRSSGTIVLYQNGVNVGSVANTTNNSTTTNYIGGGVWQPTAAGATFNGYLSNLRISNTARYTSGFTPPTSAFTTDANTRLLACQSNRFADSSSNGYTITPFGTPSVQAFSPFAPTAAYSAATVGGSGYFDGTGDYLTIPSNTAFEFGSGDFTMEFSIYGTTSVTSKTFLQYGQAAVTGWTQISWGFGTDASNFPFLEVSNGVNNPQFTITSNTALRLNEWNHLAVVRSGTDFRIYLNGVSVASTTSSFSLFAPGGTVFFWIARAHDNATPRDTSGYISNLRVVKGAAVYTGAFTPPRAPLATSGAASASAYSSTTNVNTSFAASATSLLCNFTNAGVVDSTGDNVLETVGNAQISTAQSKFGGSSMYFDGTGDYLRVPYSKQWALGGDFTIEFWINYSAKGSSYPGIVCCANSNIASAPTAGWAVVFFANTSNLYFETQGGFGIQSSTGISTNTWTHCAVVRSGSTVTMYINGTSVGSGTSSTTFDSTSDPLLVGINRGFADTITGYIDDLRIARFARYTANFVPPTSALQLQ
jgi:hypothetical protein